MVWNVRKLLSLSSSSFSHLWNRASKTQTQNNSFLHLWYTSTKLRKTQQTQTQTQKTQQLIPRKHNQNPLTPATQTHESSTYSATTNTHNQNPPKFPKHLLSLLSAYISPTLQVPSRFNGGFSISLFYATFTGSYCLLILLASLFFFTNSSKILGNWVCFS